MKATPFASLALAAAALAGCRSTASPPRHDYLSLNRSSTEFVRETGRKSKTLRRQNLKESLDMAPELAQIRRDRPLSLRFGIEAAFGKPFAEFGSMVGNGTKSIRDDARMAGRSVRFGFLDGGD
jgi:hypothetical protein